MRLFDSLQEAGTGKLSIWEGERLVERPWGRVVADAHRIAAGLRARGLGGGQPVPCVLTNSVDVVGGMLGIWLAGGAVASLPVPARAMGLEEYAEQQAAICEHAGVPALLLERKLVEPLRGPLKGRVELVAWDSLEAPRPAEPELPGEDDPAFIQYSSGSTSWPKGCVLTARAIASQLEAIAAMAGMVPGDGTVASWLPLSHDMGAFGCLLCSWSMDLDLVLSSPARFIRDPRTWFEDCAAFEADFTAGPPSALRTATRAQRTRALPAPLRLRACVIGGEQIAWPVIEAATEALCGFGLEPEIWMPAYGMAEATLTVTSVDLDRGPSAVSVDGAALAEGRIEEVEPGRDGATAVVSVGRPRGGAEVRIADPSRLSEILVRSPSLASGYFRDPVRTAERFRDGELATGDLGFIRDGELHVVGREDDMLSVAGRNVYAGEIEAAVDLFDGVRSGCSTVVDVGQESRSSLVILLELKDEGADCRRLAGEASRAAKARAGVLIDECVFLPPGALPKTPSGKIQRFRCRHLLTAERLEPLQRVRLRL